MERHNTKVQLNKNAGFSLIELLIAVIVLAIIIVPFTRSFISSSRMNGNSRRLQRATTVAQDIMEGLKAYNIDELKEQFAHPEDGFYVIDNSLVRGSAAIDTDNTDEAAGIYYFTMEDVRIQNVEYDALIKLDASVYKEGNLKSDDSNNKHDNALNTSYGLAQPGSVVKGRDGSYIQSMDTTKDALSEIQNSFGLTDPDALPDKIDAEGNKVKEDFSFNIFKNMGGSVKRTITLDIDKETKTEKDEDGNEIEVDYCNAKIKIEYECTDGVTSKTIIVTGDDSDPYTPCGMDITSGNFYLFYYPFYEAKVNTPEWTDNIIIDNKSGKPFQIFIVKQVEMSSELDADGNQKPVLSDSQLDIAEKQYKVNVNIKDSSGDLKNTAIRTNLGMNLVNSTYAGGVTRPADGKMPTYEVEKEDGDIKSHVKYLFNGSDLGDSTGVNVFGLAGTKFRGTGETNIRSDKITEVIFDIEVSIYKQGACDEDFPESLRLVRIEGSKNN
ncbi:MAG: prepilin-type N-terminal cleavage/methylation domain-containing protein [Butyrivibrio sp.]|nr:prepilin-type N-terminal cleavage/methylation domain-containing protein [Butyrivibrio sp.]MCM1263918.1 prepilin-type N-terminal cleavage/methylation domain-containing protein [Butyrivibrio sp.]